MDRDRGGPLAYPTVSVFRLEPPSRQSPRLFAAAFLVFFAFLVVLFGADSSVTLLFGKEATATIDSVERMETVVRPSPGGRYSSETAVRQVLACSYRTEGGATVRWERHLDAEDAAPAVGETFRVRYMPVDPSSFVLPDDPPPLAGELVAMGVAAVLVLLAFRSVFRNRDPRV